MAMRKVLYGPEGIMLKHILRLYDKESLLNYARDLDIRRTIRKRLNEKYPDIGCFEFQLWSLGGFSPNALNMLKDAREMTKKYRNEFFDKDQILNMIKQHNAQHLTDLLRKHF